MGKPTSGGAGGSGGRGRVIAPAPVAAKEYPNLQTDSGVMDEFVRDSYAAQMRNAKSGDEAELNDYQMGSWINDEFLRKEGATADAQTLRHLAALDGNIGELDRDLNVYRGTAVPGLAAQVRTFGKSLMRGKIIKDNGFISTSLDRNVANSFFELESGNPDATVLKIRAPKGTRGVYMNPNTSFGEQREFLINRGTGLRIISVQKRGNGFFVEAEVVQ